ncbi:MAG TPA: glutaredoxin family protein [Rhodocyclaceae bacterium]|nr:glutaredoxin family protein [Rhodocyclaceae bacterium]
MTSNKPLLVLYSRTYCHLCEDMLNALEPLKQHYVFDIQVEDVDADPALEALYDERVPVLVAEGRELCHYFLDEAAIRAFFESARTPQK